WRYYRVTRDRDLLHQAFPRLKRNFREYWTDTAHRTPTGLATNADRGNPYLPANLSAEAETGLDWTPIFSGDVRCCVPLITNCALVRYARDLARMADELGERRDRAEFSAEAERRAAKIRGLCWNDERGFFLEYDFVAQAQLPYLSDCALWTLW